MAGNQFYGVIGQNRGSAFAEAAQSILGQVKAQEDAKLANIWAPASKLDPQSQQEYFNQLPPDVQAKLRAKGVFVAPPPMTPEQQNARGMAGLQSGLIKQATDAQTNKTPFTPDQLLAGFANPDLAGKAPWMGQAGQRYNYANQGQLPAEVPQAQRVSDSLAEGVPDQLKREQQAAQFAANQKQQQSQFDTEIGMKRPLVQAQTDAARAQANKVRSETSMMGGGGGGALPSIGGAGGEEFLKTLPSGTAQLVKKIANYEMDLKQVSSLRNEQRQILAQLVAQYDPTFDMTQYANRQKLRQDFNSGKAAQNIRSINTVVKHLGSLQKAADSLDNFSFTPLNYIKNPARKATGDASVTRFGMAANAVESELASVFKNMGATDQEIKAWRSNLNDTQSPEQLRGAINQAVELMAGRMSALKDQWSSGMGKPSDFKILSDSSRQTLQKLGVDPDELDGAGATKGASDTIKTPDGLTWRRNPDGSMTQVQ